MSREMEVAQCGEHKDRGEIRQERRAGFKDHSETYSTCYFGYSSKSSKKALKSFRK